MDLAQNIIRESKVPFSRALKEAKLSAYLTLKLLMEFFQLSSLLYEL